jgi:hypothetical protein
MIREDQYDSFSNSMRKKLTERGLPIPNLLSKVVPQAKINLA